MLYLAVPSKWSAYFTANKRKEIKRLRNNERVFIILCLSVSGSGIFAVHKFKSETTPCPDILIGHIFEDHINLLETKRFLNTI
jgi:hypothetical protein